MIKIIRLSLILTIFCIISAFGLALVYIYTQPIIESNAKLALTKGEQEVLPLGQGKVFQVSPQGYGGPISMLVGVGSSGEVTGVKILSQRETPGLGANIVKVLFLQQFIGKTVKDPLEPKQDIDAITGATISTKAVCWGVKDALQRATSEGQ
jgi:Na+-translocating ferredoxin:NAD+ oxidoreductase RnfG subunit